VITGFNTDIVHDGVVYHVQTEDKGLDSPIILSLVYSGGEILASKRAPYEDLLASGFTEAALAERLKRQHTLICAAIHAGRIEDLKRMTGLQASRGRTRTDQIEIPQPPVKEPEPVVTAKPEVPNLLDEIELTPATPQYQPTVVEVAPEPPPAQFEPQPEPDVAAEPVTISSGSGTVADVYTVHDSRRQSPLGDLPSDQRLVVTLLEEQEFHSGASLTVRVKVSERSGKTDKPLNGITVSMKVLGTTFRPQIYTAKTGRNGIAAVALQIPKFTSGRAALLIRASVQENATEIRRLVHPGK
jgi:hypothetical protein